MLAYTIKSVIFLSMMYIPYMLMLRKESFFHFNRILLVCIMLLSLILPLCDFHALSIENNPIQHGMTTITMPTVAIGAGEEMPVSDNTYRVNIILYIYILGVVMIAIWKLVQIYLLYRAIHSCVLWKDKQNGITIYCHAQDIAPFSWFNTIVISENDYQNNAKEILCHEIGHIRHYHSLDILLVNIIETIQWWNPLSWILASSLRDVHEYEADNEARTSGVNIREYQMLLIRKAVGSSSYAFANGFNHSLLKKRITMLLRSKSNPWMRTKALYIIPVATIAISVFATPELNNRVDTIAEKVETSITNKDTNIFSTDKVSGQENTSTNEIKEKIAKNAKDSLTAKVEEYTRPAWDTCTWNENDPATWHEKYKDPQADVKPQFPGGIEALDKYLMQYKHLYKTNGPTIWVDLDIEEDGSVIVKSCSFGSWIKVDEKREQIMIKEVTYNDILSLFKEYKEDYIISMSNNSKYYAYELNNEYIGFICILDLDTELEIIDVFVLPKYQGNGYGDKLLKYILDNYKNRNYFLEVNINNEKAINLYKKNGFDILTTRKHYYKDEDAYVMSKAGE